MTLPNKTKTDHQFSDRFTEPTDIHTHRPQALRLGHSFSRRPSSAAAAATALHTDQQVEARQPADPSCELRQLTSSPWARAVCDAAPNGRSGRTPGGTSCTRMAWRQCVYECGASVRRSARNSSCSSPRSRGTASRLRNTTTTALSYSANASTHKSHFVCS